MFIIEITKDTEVVIRRPLKTLLLMLEVFGVVFATRPYSVILKKGDAVLGEEQIDDD